MNDQNKYKQTNPLFGGWVELLKRQVDYSSSFNVDCVGHSGGLLLLWQNSWDVSIKSYSKGHIEVMVTNEKDQFGILLIFTEIQKQLYVISHGVY